MHAQCIVGLPGLSPLMPMSVTNHPAHQSKQGAHLSVCTFRLIWTGKCWQQGIHPGAAILCGTPLYRPASGCWGLASRPLRLCCEKQQACCCCKPKPEAWHLGRGPDARLPASLNFTSTNCAPCELDGQQVLPDAGAAGRGTVFIVSADTGTVPQ